MLSRADAADIDGKYYLELVSVAILYYDYALTFQTELSLFWSSQQFKWGTVIFFLNRYTIFFGYMPTIVELFFRNPEDNLKTCHKLTSYQQYMTVIVQAIVAVIMISRTYALWSCSIKILAFLLALFVAVAALAMWTLGIGSSHPNSYALPHGIIGCHFPLSFDRSWHMGVGWALVVVFDTIIFALTVYKSLKITSRHHRTIADVLLRDGAAYFAVMGSATLANVFTFMLGRVG